MDRGTYALASAGMANLLKMEIANNNLANLSTAGFKKQSLVGEEQTFDQTLAAAQNINDPYAKGDHDRTPGIVSLETVTDFSPGPVNQTQAPLDVALTNPNDFFVVQVNGEQLYTRAGNFRLDIQGQVVTPDGYPVQGEGGPIVVTGSPVQIQSDGGVIVNGENVGRLGVVRFDDLTALQRDGASRFRLRPGAAAPQQVQSTMLPGSLEASNVSAIESMIDLITVNRAFEQYTRAAQAIDGLNQKAIMDIGRR
ncbi:MAG: flagellar hook-basal body protein [Bdellovibrionales bacterium]|nr:flagellar hook-basal body protein [Bdellovibrionales bacterium]